MEPVGDRGGSWEIAGGRSHLGQHVGGGPAPHQLELPLGHAREPLRALLLLTLHWVRYNDRPVSPDSGVASLAHLDVVDHRWVAIRD